VLLWALLGAGTTTASAATFTYDISIVARVGVTAIGAAGAGPAQLIGAREESVLPAVSGRGWPGPDEARPELPPMEGTGFLTQMATPPALPYEGPEGPWLTEADLDAYADLFGASGFFGPVSYYRNLDANYDIVKDLGPSLVTMPTYFIGGSLDPVNLMDPNGVERMKNVLPDFRGHTMIEGVGHWTQQEAPGAFNKALLGFLESL
jgi:pimeloyl-ACP methyl ester carboxylesterase